MVDLPIKVGCFVKKTILCQYEKQLIRTSKYKEVDCTDPSPTVRISSCTSNSNSYGTSKQGISPFSLPYKPREPLQKGKDQCSFTPY
jgi:hypothetical protein